MELYRGESENLVILGVTFDAKLTFEKHVRSISRSVCQKLGIMRRAWRVFGDHSLLLLCFISFALPVIEYCSPVHGIQQLTTTSSSWMGLFLLLIFLLVVHLIVIRVAVVLLHHCACSSRIEILCCILLTSLCRLCTFQLVSLVVH